MAKQEQKRHNKIRSKLCVVREDMVNNKISECSKLTQKEYKTRHDEEKKMIHRKFCKKFKFDYTSKLYLHHTESVQENEKHKILLDFEMQMDYLISARRPDLVTVNLRNNALCRSGWPHGKTERKQKTKKTKNKKKLPR